MKKYFVHYIIFSSYLLICCTNDNYETEDKKVDEILINFIKENKIPGLSLTVLNSKGQTRYSKGFGFADLEKKSKIDPSKSIFRIGSFSKTLTATALMKLYQNNRIEIDSSVSFYIENLPDDKKNITLKQISGHLSGIRHYVKEDGMKINKDYKTNLEALEIFIDDTLLFDPGKKYSYSTHAWTLLSLAMENAYGDTFINLMNKEIFSPLKLTRTHAEQYDLSFENKVSFYEKNDFDSVIKSNPVNNSWKWAGGGYISTTEEMAKFTWNILNSDFLKSDILDLMLSPQVLVDGNKTSYGIGWAIREKNNKKFLGHTGGSVGGTTFIFSSESGDIVSLMANLSNVSFGDIPLEIFKIFNN